MDNLPASIRDLAEVIGLAAALALVERWPGVPVDIPQQQAGTRCEQRKRLIEALGEAATAQLIDYAGGTRLHIPRCAEALRARRNAQMVDEYMQSVADGAPLSASAQALRWGVTERWVREIRQRAGVEVPAPAQVDMFG